MIEGSEEQSPGQQPEVPDAAIDRQIDTQPREEDEHPEANIDVHQLNRDAVTAMVQLIDIGYVKEEASLVDRRKSMDKAVIGIPPEGASSSASLQVVDVDHRYLDYVKKQLSDPPQEESRGHRTEKAMAETIDVSVSDGKGETVSMQMARRGSAMKLTREGLHGDAEEHDYSIDSAGNVTSAFAFWNVPGYDELRNEIAAMEDRAREGATAEERTTKALEARVQGVALRQAFADQHRDEIADRQRNDMEFFTRTFPQVHDALGIVRDKAQEGHRQHMETHKFLAGASPPPSAEQQQG